MSRLTNRAGLPEPLVNALRKQRYSRGDARKSVTQLIDSPRVDMLRARHAADITIDAAERLWALMGTALHSVLEAGADEQHIPEERLFATMGGWRISGGIDLQVLRDGAVGLRDYKMTSVWSVMNPKPAWTQQLNCYAWLIREAKGYAVEDAEIVAICRDWNRSEAKRKADYPQAPVVRIPIELWPEAEAARFVQERVRAHQDALRAAEWGEALPECSEAERWARPSAYAVMKPGRKSAVRVFETDAAAQSFLAAHPDADKLSIVERLGSDVRCEGNYCQVAEWCDRMKEKEDQ